MLMNLSVCPPDVCVADVDSFASQRIPDSDGQISPLSTKKGWKKRRMDVKEPSGKCFHHLGQLSRSTCVCCAQLTDKFHLGLCLQVRSGTPVCAPQIVPTVCAAPVISGLVSASLCCGRDRFARDTAGKGTMAWNCSSAAHVATDSAAELYESQADGLRRPRPGSQHPLHRLATPPPTRRCCLHPQSHHHQQWQRPDFMCARKTREGWMERV